MRAPAICLLAVGVAAMPAVVLNGLESDSSGQPREAAAITVDYPADGSIFPPEITAPAFLWRDAAADATVWRIDITFADGSTPLHLTTAGERMRTGEIDPEAVAPSNEPPKLTPQQAQAHTWTPDAATWAAIKKRTVERRATVTITGYHGADASAPVSRGRVTMMTSRDPVGAPVFYRDVPLMPNQSDQGVIKPLPANAIGLIKWRLRYIGEPESRTVMERVGTCANCHSFSADGKTMGLDVDGPQNDRGLYALVNLEKETTIRPRDVIKWPAVRDAKVPRLRAAFMSQVSPDGRYVVTMIDDPEAKNRAGGRELEDKYYNANFLDYRFLQVFYPTRGILAWYSRQTGRLQPLPGADDPRYVQTDGVWSPDGRYLVFARAEARSPNTPGAPQAVRANDPNETQIQYDLYRVPFNEGRGGKAERIAGASGNGMSNNFPKVSPDGKWIVFVQCRNAQLMRPDSKLYIVPAQGGTARLMKCNTSLMNSWHSFSPNGRWLAFSSKSRSPYTQMFLTHIDENGNDSPAILVDRTTAANRAVNLPEFVNVPPDGLTKINPAATIFYARANAAYELMRKSEFRAAVEAWRTALELGPDDSRAHFNLAYALNEEGRAEEAIGEYEKSRELDPENAAVYLNLGLLYAQNGKLDEAVVQFRTCLKQDAHNAAAEANLGAALLAKGETEESVTHCRKAVEIDAVYADGYNKLALAVAKAGRPDEAVRHFQKATELAPASVEYQFNLGYLLARLGRFGEAITPFERAVELTDGKELQDLSMLATVYSKSGRRDDAVKTANRALDLALAQKNEDVARAIRASIAKFEGGDSGR